MNIKDITIPIIHYYLLSYSEHYTNLSTPNHNVRFLSQHRGVTQYMRAKPCAKKGIVSIYSRTSPGREVLVRAVDIVNPGIQWRFIAPDINNINTWNFNSLFRVILIFYTYDSANFKKASGITLWKNATRYCAGPAYYSVLNRRLLSKQTGSSSTKGNHHPSFLLLNWAEETVDAAKICGGAENVVKTEPSKHS